MSTNPAAATIPDDMDGRLALGAQAVQSGDLGLAAACFAGAHDLQPENPQILQHLFTILNARGDLKSAESALQRLSDLAPHDTNILFQLGMLKGRRGNNAGACEDLEKAAEIDPGNIAAETFYAVWSQGIVDRFHEVPGLLNNAAEKDGQGAHLGEIADVLIYQQHYEDAVQHLKTLETIKGGLDLVQLRHIAVALKEMGQDDEAKHVFETAISVCDRMIGETWPAPTTLDQIPAAIRPKVMELLALTARLYFNGGAVDQARELYKAMGAASSQTLQYGEPYWPDTDQRVARLRAMMRGRDVVLMCHGHSIKDFGARIKEMDGRDACFVGINRFGVLESEILTPAGRKLELTLSLTPGSILKQGEDFEAFLSRNDSNMAFVSGTAMNAAFTPEERDNLRTRFDAKLIAVNNNNLRSVTPDDPLGVIQENTLLAALPLIVAGAPRRVFLMGADQRIDTDGSTDSHFGTRSEHFKSPEKTAFVAPSDDRRSLKNFDQTMINDAKICDRDVAYQVMAMAALHGFEEPAVYNVSPNSRLEAFEKIDLDRFLEMVGQDTGN